MFGVARQGFVTVDPGSQLKRRKERLQIVTCAEAVGDKAYGVLCSRCERATGTRSKTGDVVEDDALADIRSPNDGYDQIGIIRKLGQQLANKQVEPVVTVKRRHLEGGRTETELT